MKTKEQILHEIINEEKKDVEKYAIKEMENLADAIKGGDLFAIGAGTLAKVLVDGVNDEAYINKNVDDKRIVLLKTIYATFDSIRKAEEIYAAQFNVEKEGK